MVRYGRLGHYSCHYDSSKATGVRLATLGVFLNTPTEGGEVELQKLVGNFECVSRCPISGVFGHY